MEAVELEPRSCPSCGCLPYEIEAFGDLELICGNCKDLFLKYMHENSTPIEGDFLDSPFMEGNIFYGGDLDVSVDMNSDPNQWNSEDDDENPVGTPVGRIWLHRSLATNGRNLPDDWLNQILSRESDIRNRDRRRPNGGEDYLELLAETEHSRLGAPPAAVSFVENLEPVVVGGKESDEGLVCVICKDEVSVGTVVYRLPCRHIYHPLCIVPWLNARNTCPLCRYEVPTDDKDYEKRRTRSHETQDVEDVDEGGSRRWWFVAAPIVSMVGIGLVLWFGGGIFDGFWATQRDDTGSRRWWRPF